MLASLTVEKRWRQLATFSASMVLVVLVTPVAAQEADAAELLEVQIRIACEGRGGEIDPAGFIEQDLTGDGEPDLIIAHEMITCESPPDAYLERSQKCGMQVCEVLIYTRVDGQLVLEEDFWGGGITLGPTRIPVISGYSHGGDTWSTRWDGSAFR